MAMLYPKDLARNMAKRGKDDVNHEAAIRNAVHVLEIDRPYDKDANIFDWVKDNMENDVYMDDVFMKDETKIDKVVFLFQTKDDLFGFKMRW